MCCPQKCSQTLNWGQGGALGNMQVKLLALLEVAAATLQATPCLKRLAANFCARNMPEGEPIHMSQTDVIEHAASTPDKVLAHESSYLHRRAAQKVDETDVPNQHCSVRSAVGVQAAH